MGWEDEFAPPQGPRVPTTSQILISSSKINLSAWIHVLKSVFYFVIIIQLVFFIQIHASAFTLVCLRTNVIYLATGKFDCYS